METPTPGKPPANLRWAVIKDRLAIASVIVVLVILLFMMIDGSIENAAALEFITFQCNRWDAREKPWE